MARHHRHHLLSLWSPRTLLVSLAVSTLALVGTTGATASGLGYEEVVQGGFQMGALLPRQESSQNLATFQPALGGVSASAITFSGSVERPYEVDGDTFPDYATAATRSCDNQHQTCANLSNNKTGTFSVGECDSQLNQCGQVAKEATVTTFGIVAVATSDAQFDVFCDV